MTVRLADYVARIPAARSGTYSGPAEPLSFECSFPEQLRALRLHWRGLALLGTHALETGCTIAGWVFIGSGALLGQFDSGWMMAWALCIVSTVPLRAASAWLTEVIALTVGGALRERLLVGATEIDVDAIRNKGSGELLSEVLEVEQIEHLAAAGGIGTLLAALEWLGALLVFTRGVDAWTQCALLAAWGFIALGLLAHNTRKRVAWTQMRFELTRRLVETMSAHRTRAVQQPLAERHVHEDRDLARYADESRVLDRSTAFIHAVLARGYVITALLALAPSLLAGDAAVSQQAITLGGILLGAAASRRFASGFVAVASAWIAARRMLPLFEASRVTPPEPDIAGPAAIAPAKVLTAEDLVFAHRTGATPVVNGCTLTLRRGDFVLLEGDSGCGKSTLAALLAGLRGPQAGVVLAGGLDRHTWGRAWRSRVALAPQDHENHILCASLAFNLLLARPLPHSSQDLADAAAVCVELGLGPLLARMPAGLNQMIGESGWQLSQGERARVFLARALLQNAQVLVLDESFASLDPENQIRCMQSVIRRAQTVLAIAHH